MKNNKSVNLFILTCFALTFIFYDSSSSIKKSNPTLAHKLSPERFENFAGWLEDEFIKTRDPRTGEINDGILDAAFEQARKTPKRNAGTSKTNAGNNISFVGPNNLGGRTRALAFDVRNANIILAGGVSGGVFRSVDAGEHWSLVSEWNEVHSVSSIVQSGFNKEIWYYATGESLGNTASGQGAFYLGNGVYKSIDNGITWKRLPNSNIGARESLDDVNDVISKIVVDPNNGYIYTASLGQILRSTDDGLSWNAVLGTFENKSNNITDIVCTTNGSFYAAFNGSFSDTFNGVWMSNNGASGTWIKIADDKMVTGWKSKGSYGRIVLASAPGNGNILYALYYNGKINDCSKPAIEADFFKYDKSKGTWENRSDNLPDEEGCSELNDPFCCQRGYDLCIAVKPDDENFVIIGGTNLYRSTDGFASNKNSTRIGGYLNPKGYEVYANTHPDLHILVYKPGDRDTLWTGDDGGIQKGNVSNTKVEWKEMNTNYSTYQYYHVAIDPTPGSDNIIGGTQDNGTTYNRTGSTGKASMVLSGDGCSVGISSNNVYHHTSYQLGGMVRRTPGMATDEGVDISPAAGGQFVTNFYLDPDNTEYLYYGHANELYRTLHASTTNNATSSGNWSLMSGCSDAVKADGQINCFATTRGTYNVSTASLFFGTYQGLANKPKVFRLDDPKNTGTTSLPVDITPADTAWAKGAYVSGIAVNPQNDDTITVTLSNYGVSSIWWTGNANAASPTWQAIEGNINLLSIRCCAIVACTTGIEYYVGTHVGLYSTNNINGNSTTWSQEGAAPGSLGYAVVRSLALRTSDNHLLAGTHGNGIWLVSIPNPLPLIIDEFKARLVNRFALLEWNILAENNNTYFDILRRFEHESLFLKIGRVEGQGFTGTNNRYNYTDRNLDWSAKEVFYQIRKVESVQEDYSNTEQIGLQIDHGIFIPTLFHHELIIGMMENSSPPFSILLTDMTGRQKQFLIDNTTVKIDISFMPRGTYVLKLTDSNGLSMTRKIIFY